MTETHEEPAPRPSRADRRRKWRRRALWTVAIVAALAVTLRILVNLLLPTVLRKVAATYDLNCTYERSELSLFSGDAGLWYLNFIPKTGGEPVMKFNYVRGNISVLALLRGRLEVWRMEADGAQILLERAPDGSFPQLARFLADATAPAPFAPKAPASPQEIDLTPPIRIEALRLSHVQTRLIDHSVSPVFDSTVTMNVRVSDVRSSTRPMTFQIDLWNELALDLLRVEGTANASGQNVEADVRLIVRGFQPLKLAHYLQPLGVNPVTRAIAAQGTGKLRLEPAAQGALAGSLVFQDAFIWSEGEEVAAMQRLEVKADSIDFNSTKVAKVLIEGVRVHAGASSAGTVRVAGFELAPIAPENAPRVPRPPSPPSRSSPTPPPSTQPWTLPYRIEVAETSLRKVHAVFDDHSFTPAAQLVLEIDDLTARGFVADPNKPDAIVDLSGTMRAPGLSDKMTLAGQVAPFAATKTIKLAFSAEQVDPQSLRPYLDAAGLESELRSGAFTAELVGQATVQPDGRLAADAHITKLHFADAVELLAMNDVQVHGASVDPQSGRIRVDSIDISGPRLRARRDASGQISMLGLRTKPVAGARASSMAVAPSTAPAAAIELPRLQIGRLSWKDLKLQFDDESIQPPATIALADAGVEITDLLIDSSSTAEAQPGKLRAWLAAPGVIETLSVEGQLTPQPQGLAADLRVAGSGITASAIKPYLTAAGVESQLTDGRFDLHAKATIAQLANGVTASLALDQVRYLDGETELAGVDALRLDQVKLTSEEVSIGTLTIDRPRATAMRDAQGHLVAGGIKLLKPAPTTQAAAPSATQPTQLPSLDLPIQIALAQLHVNEAQLRWIDQHVTPGVDATANITAQVDSLVLGRDAEPARFTLKLASAGAARRLDVTGKLTTAPDTQGIDMNVNGQGLSGELLSPYLPAGLQVLMRDGQLDALVSASVSKHAQGGHGARLSIKDVTLANGVDAKPLFKIESLSTVASRVDPAGGVIAIDEIALSGVDTDVHIAADGATRALGIALVPVPASPTTQPSTAPVAVAPSQDVAALVTAARKTPPLLTIEKLDINLARLAVHNDSIPGSAPLTLANVRVHNTARIEVGGADADSRPPAQITLAGTLDPIVESFDVQTKVAALAQQPSLTIDVNLSGVRGEGLTQLVPQLQSFMDGNQLTDGRFRTHVEVLGKFARRGPVEFDFSRPFDLELQVNDTEFRGSADGPVLAGLTNLRAEAIRVDPQTGGIHVKTLELTKPMGNAWRDKDGIHVLGWVIKLPTTADVPASAPAGESTVLLAAEQTTAPPTAPVLPPEMRIDRLLVSELDLRIEDRAVDPPMVIPLNGLDVEVRDLSNLALYENRPIRFNALVTSGPAPLPSVRKDASPTDIEPRELFSQITASGKVSLHPRVSGWVKTSINGFEMVSLQGLAHEKEITLGKGVFDGTVDTRFPGDGSMESRAKLVMTNLQISEPAGGILQRVLVLPATLDVVIGVLQDPDDSITIPLTVPIKQGEISWGAVTGSAVGALGQVIVTAMASTGVKATQGVTDMLGITGKQESEPQIVELSFAPGVTGLDPSQQQELDQLITRLRKDANTELTLRHELGGGDVLRAESLANPSREQCLNLAYRLRNRKIDLLSQRSQLAGQARGIIASASAADASQVVSRLRDIDQQIAQTEDALDKVYDLLRPGAERQRDRRTRAASLEMAEHRLDQARSYLLSSNVPQGAERIRGVNPAFAPIDSDGGGKIVITVISKKKQ